MNTLPSAGAGRDTGLKPNAKLVLGLLWCALFLAVPSRGQSGIEFVTVAIVLCILFLPIQYAAIAVALGPMLPTLMGGLPVWYTDKIRWALIFGGTAVLWFRCAKVSGRFRGKSSTPFVALLGVYAAAALLTIAVSTSITLSLSKWSSSLRPTLSSSLRPTLRSRWCALGGGNLRGPGGEKVGSSVDRAAPADPDWRHRGAFLWLRADLSTRGLSRYRRQCERAWCHDCVRSAAVGMPVRLRQTKTLHQEPSHRDSDGGSGLPADALLVARECSRLSGRNLRRLGDSSPKPAHPLRRTGGGRVDRGDVGAADPNRPKSGKLDLQGQDTREPSIAFQENILIQQRFLLG